MAAISPRSRISPGFVPSSSARRVQASASTAFPSVTSRLSSDNSTFVLLHSVRDPADAIDLVVSHDHVADPEDDPPVADALEDVLDEGVQLLLGNPRLEERRGDDAPDDRPLPAAPGVPDLVEGRRGERRGREGLADVEARLRDQVEERLQVPVRVAAHALPLAVEDLRVLLVVGEAPLAEEVRG